MPFDMFMYPEPVLAKKIKCARPLLHAWQYGGTALHHASQRGHTNVVKEFLTAGIDVNKAGNVSLLHFLRQNRLPTCMAPLLPE